MTLKHAFRAIVTTVLSLAAFACALTVSDRMSGGGSAWWADGQTQAVVMAHR